MPPGSATVPPSASVPIDPSLLAILPSQVDGQPVHEFVQGEESDATDPNLVRNVTRFATAFVSDPGLANWAYAAVVVLRPGVGTDSFFRDWRDSFDQGACQQAGGVTGHATTTIAGQTVDIGTCATGVRTYHVRLDARGILISIASLGDGRYGELLLRGLTP